MCDFVFAFFRDCSNKNLAYFHYPAFFKSQCLMKKNK